MSTAPQLSDLSKLNNELANLQREVARRNSELESVRDSLASQVEERTRALAETVDDLVRAMKAKDAFFTRMSHDLRTPLNSIIGFSDLLLKGYAGDLSEEQVTQIRMINGSGFQLLAFVNDILELSDADSECVEPHVARLNVREAVDSVLGEARASAEERGIALVVREAPGVVIMHSDAVVLHRILRVLLSNAIRYTDEGEVRLEVARGQQHRVEFRVIDSGIGVAPCDEEVIFEAFSHVEREDRELRRGSGLGLAMARHLAEGLGGSLTLESSGRSGSTFLLSLPSRAGNPQR